MKVLLMILALSAAAGQTKVYRWVDEDGVVHYSGQPPASVETAAEEMTVQTSGVRQAVQDTPEPAENTGPSADDLEAQLDPLSAEPTPEELVQRRTQINRINCERARGLVASLEPEGRVVLRYPDGTTKTLFGDERVAELEKARRMVRQYC